MAAATQVPGEGDDDASPRYRPGYELVAEQLLNYIEERKLRAGDRLPTEQGLAEILGASRNVTREAVKVLAAIGRLSVRRGAGIFVAESTGGLVDDQLSHFRPTSMEHVLMLLDYRTVIESETAHRAASLATPIEVRTIRECAESSLEAARTADGYAFARADEAFHDAVGAAAHNVFLRASVANVRRFASQSDVLLFHGDAPGSLEVAAGQHLAIAEAVAAGEADLATQLMAEHIATTQSQFERKIRDRLFNLDSRGASGAPAQPPRSAGAADEPSSPQTSAS
ncbi:FCD domain-containing protein [Streptomyces sp. MI02-2A]|uniref:FadR/GntR family transcriptional regulator n=1 Tax=unclassified Streptomyces TaxID=2593676 RepID=UPI000E25246A|nr:MULTISPECIES: FCD domain-containing protein [unclassified Streptomyces]MDX3262926.1 FCD domain-containing protein [Streptomyces sp. MI02-2A]REE66289.1 DNA-binding FadR family transcriptional regulator [Streptomyces sp. 3212.3]